MKNDPQETDRCPEWTRDRWADLALDRLTPEETDEARRHLARCDACRREFTDLAPIAHDLRQAFHEDETEPTPDLRAQIVARAASEPHPASNASIRPAVFTRRVAAVLAGIAAGIALMAIGLSLLDRNDPATDPAAPIVERPDRPEPGSAPSPPPPGETGTRTPEIAREPTPEPPVERLPEHPGETPDRVPTPPQAPRLAETPDPPSPGSEPTRSERTFEVVQVAGVLERITGDSRTEGLRPGDQHRSTSAIRFAAATGPSRLRLDRHHVEIREGTTGTIRKEEDRGWSIDLTGGEVFCLVSAPGDLEVRFAGGAVRAEAGSFGVALVDQRIRILAERSVVTVTGPSLRFLLEPGQLAWIGEEASPRIEAVDANPLLAWRAAFQPNRRAAAHRRHVAERPSPDQMRARQWQQRLHERLAEPYREEVLRRQNGTAPGGSGRGGGRGGRR